MEAENNHNKPRLPDFKGNGLQTPEKPWDVWLTDLSAKFAYLRVESDTEKWPPTLPNLPQEFLPIRWDIPDKDGFNLILQVNQVIRSALSSKSDGVFYRPGIGFGGATHEILEKIGSFTHMISSDPVYEDSKMESWSEGLLPVNYYFKTLQVIGATDIKILRASVPNGEFQETDEEVSRIKIPNGEAVQITCEINGIPHAISLLTEDMTKYRPGKIDILSLGRPTPMDGSYKDPRWSNAFGPMILSQLNADALVEYHGGNFQFLPPQLPVEAFGFQNIYAKDGLVVVQKDKNLRRKYKETFQIAEKIGNTVQALSGMEMDGWLRYFREAGYGEDGQHIDRGKTLDDVVISYAGNLKTISEFVSKQTNPYIKQLILSRLEFLFMSPIASEGKLDEEKILNINKAPSNPDEPNSDNNHGPYFGRVDALIADHNSGIINIFNFYDQLVSIFYTTFPSLQKINPQTP